MSRFKSFTPLLGFMTLIMLLAVWAVPAPTAVDANTLPPDVSASTASAYTISGRVTDSDGNPVPGVTINAYSCDLSKQPVLLIHGWGGPDIMAEDTSGFAQLAKWMSEDGYVEGCNLFYVTGVSSFNSKEQNRQNIQSFIRSKYYEIKGANPSWNGHFDIIGHSYGGLNARFYLESNYYRNDQQLGIKIDNLFTLGTPHGGIQPLRERYLGAAVIGWDHLPKSWLDFIIYSIDKGKWYDFLSAAQLHSLTMDYYNRNSGQPHGVCYRLIGGDFLQQNDVPITFRGLYELVPPGDIGVSLRSSQQLGINPSLSFRFPRVSYVTNDDMHGYIGGLAGGISGLEELDSYVNPGFTYAISIKNSIGAGWTQCPQTDSPGQRMMAEEPLFIPPIEIGAGQLTTGQTDAVAFPVDWSGQGVFYVSWEGGDADFTLEDGNGAQITPIVAESDQNITYEKLASDDGGLATYVITDTVAGLWSYSVSAVSAPYPITYTVHANAETTLVAEAFAPEVSALSEPVVLTATVTAAGTPVAGAVVTATVTRPDGSQSSIGLLDNGAAPDAAAADGVYSGSYLDTSQAGFYVVDAVAEGTHVALDFKRTTAAVFSITPNMASLQGGYGDSAIDEDGNGLYEYLEFAVDIDVAETGTLLLSAMLMGSGGQLIDHASQVANVTTPGVQQITVRFSGEAIRAGDMDGPFTVESVTLLDDDTFILLDEDAAGWQTASYLHDTFGFDYETYLPLIIRDGASGARAEEITRVASEQATANYSTITDSSGYYTIVIPSEGEYSVVPRLSGYSFVPAVQIRSLPPSVSGINFILQSGANPPPSGDMVFVPAGEFPMGCDLSNNGGFGCYSDMLPLHMVYLDAYYIDKYEVTNDQYAAFLNSRISNDCDGYECIELDSIHTHITYQNGQYVVESGYGNHPVIEVSWYGADLYCTDRGSRLPTEAEWEKAARGTTVRTYPWGNQDPNCTLANSYDDATYSYCVGDTTPVGSYPTVTSPYGALDMAGNVWEWVNDWYAADYYSSSPYSNPKGPSIGTHKVLRGGSWDGIWNDLRTDYRFNSGLVPTDMYYSLGFRCVVTAGE